MPHLRIAGLILTIASAMTFTAAAAQSGDSAADAVRVSSAQNITVGLMTGGAGSTDSRAAADLAQVLDDGDKLRVLPLLGPGSVQGIADLIFLKGVDVAIVHTDAFTAIMQQGTIPRAKSVLYIAKLFPEEVHILARRDITSLHDLAGKPVAVGAAEGGTELTATALLDNAHVKPSFVHDSQWVALERLRRGEIAAMVVVGGEPVPFLQTIEPGTDLHFLPIPLNAELVNLYLPTSLDHQRYPNLIPPAQTVDTVAVGSALITLSAPPDSLRAKRVNRFVDTLFDRFEQLRQPGLHPKWREVNLSTQIEGWTRYPEAATLLKKAQAEAATMRTSFSAYLNKSGQDVPGLDTNRREALFRDFMRWRDQHSGP